MLKEIKKIMMTLPRIMKRQKILKTDIRMEIHLLLMAKLIKKKDISGYNDKIKDLNDKLGRQ